MQGQRRIIYILERLVKEECHTKMLCLEIFGVDESKKTRLIQKDLKLLNELFPETLISTRKGFHQFIKTPNFLKTVVSKEGMEAKEFLEFISIFGNRFLALFEKDEPKLIQQLKKDIQSIYHIHENPFEYLKSPFLKDIKRAIKFHRYVSIEYRGKKELKYYKKGQIYKIIYANNNWYIMLYNQDEKGYKDYLFLRINFIENLTVLSKTFNRDIQIERFIDNFQSLFSTYNKATYEVILEADSVAMKHFLVKKHLSSQEIIEKREETLILRFQITNNMEILPLIKHWIPHIKVLSAPSDLKEVLKRDLLAYIDGL